MNQPVPKPSNTIGMVGFVVVICTTLFSPTGFCGLPLLVLVPSGIIGLILCAIGVFDKPRWPAAAGLIIGLLCVGGWLSFFGWALYHSYAHAAKFGMDMGQHTRMSMSAMGLFEDAEKQRLPGNRPALSYSFNAIPAADRVDPWNHPYHYLINNAPRGYTFLSDGPDGLPGTADDIDLSKIQDADMFPLPPFRTPAAGSK